MALDLSSIGTSRNLSEAGDTSRHPSAPFGTPRHPAAPFFLCLVTDRRRLALAAGRGLEQWRALLTRQVEGAATAGIDLVQVRERDLDARVLVSLVRGLVSVTRGSRTRILVNDRVDVALAAHADGVHLRHDSLPSSAARTILPPEALLTRSVHADGDLESVSALSYVIAGTMSATASKPVGAIFLSERELAATVRRAGRVPVLGIGGVSAATIPALVRAGACGAAAIGAFLPIEPGEDVARSVQYAAAGLRAAAERVRPQPAGEGR